LAFLQGLIYDSGTSIEEFNAKNQLKIYPNPVLYNLYLDLSETSSINKLSISDLHGKIVLIQSSNFEQVDVSELPVGEYIIRIESKEDGMKIGRFLKQ